MASRGHRVIACAQSLLPGDEYPVHYPFSKTDNQYPGSEYCFVGLISLEDPPKHGVREAIGTLRLAGIKVMMVTGLSTFPFQERDFFILKKKIISYVGDHPKTAEAIARKINLILGDTRETLAIKTDRSIEEIYEDEVSAIVIHGDDIDGLQGWQWDQSRIFFLCFRLKSANHLMMVVFSKDEIVFARTSPKHKLEIGKCHFYKTLLFLSF